ncbi:condensation domain-containing protein, partial [Pedobacter sp. UYP1]|uniref:condensation domain-containing protein n=1 Tax=Pedobacter sp. UYP1 TaxID=1756396 RepID=UPI003391BE03
MKNISAVQETIWLSQNIHTQSLLYNVGGYGFLDGKLNEPLLVRSIREVLSTTDVIAIGYYAFNDIPLSDNKDFISYDVVTIDFSTEKDADGCCLDWIHKDMHIPFEVDKNLLKISLVKAANDKCYWYVKVHHLIFDGYSMSLFFNKVITLYTAYITHASLPSVTDIYPYADFINDDKAYRLSDEFEADATFWKNRLKSGPVSKAFESCTITENSKSLTSKRRNLIIPRRLYNEIEAFSKLHNCTPFHYFISILFILNKFYNNDSGIIGIPVFNRRTKKFKNTIGTFVNVLPFSVDLDEHATFAEVLILIKNELKNCYKHQRYSLYDILQDLDIRGNIYHVNFSYQKNSYKNELDDLNASIEYINSGEQLENLVFHLLEYSSSEDLILSVDYLEDLFTPAVVERLLKHFNNLLNTCYNTADLLIRDLSYLDTSEKAALLATGEEVGYPKDKTITELFEFQATAHGSRTAVVFEEKQLSYQELNGLANQLGHYLRLNYQVQAGDLVGICLERSEWMLVAILGIL